MSKEFKTFQLAIERSNHFLFLFDLVSNQRKRSIRSDWAGKFKKLMHWNGSTSLMRVDGASSILIIKDPPLGLTREHFSHGYASELLRSSVVSSISAMDKYFHDKALNRCFSLLNGPEKNLPKKLKRLEFSALSAFKAAKKLREDPSARPGNQLKKVLQDKLHTITFQDVNGVNEAVELMDVKDFWRRVGTKLNPEASASYLQEHLRQYVRRRNQIVHEADLERRLKARKYAIRPIEKNYAQSCCKFISSFVEAADAVIEET